MFIEVKIQPFTKPGYLVLLKHQPVGLQEKRAVHFWLSEHQTFFMHPAKDQREAVASYTELTSHPGHPVT